MGVRLPDTIEPMGEFPAARAEHIEFSDGVSLQDKFNNNELGGGGDSSSTVTQEEYEALPEEEKLNGLYYCYDSQRIYKNGVQYGASKPLELTYEEWKTLREAGAISDTQECIIAAGADGILIGAEDIGYSDTLTVKGKFNEVDTVIEELDENKADKTEVDKKETVFVSNNSATVMYYAAYYLGKDPASYGLYNVIVTTNDGHNAEFNVVYKHNTLGYVRILSENGITLNGVNNVGTLALSDYDIIKVKWIGVPNEDEVKNMPNGGYSRASTCATKSDIATKQDNLSIKKAFIRRNASTSPYCLLATIDLRTLNQLMQPLRLKGVLGNMANEILNIDITINGRQGFTPTMLFGTITNKGGVLTNYANILINKSDDEQTAYVYIHFKYIYAYCDLEIYLGSTQYEVPSFELTDTMQGTAYTNLLDNTNVVNDNVINDSSTVNTYTTWSSSKIASEMLKNISKTVTLTFSDYYTTIYPSLFGLTEFSEDAIIQVTTGYYQYIVVVQNISKNNAVLRGWYAKDASSSPVLVSSGSTEAKLTYIGK